MIFSRFYEYGPVTSLSLVIRTRGGKRKKRKKKKRREGKMLTMLTKANDFADLVGIATNTSFPSRTATVALL